MNHSFDIEIAKRYGIEEAILLQNIYFWIEKNRVNNKHFYNGTYWTYNSKKAFADLFPYMTPRKIDYTLNKLINEGLIITDCFNEDGRDRTLWYALTKMGYCILQNCEMQFTKTENEDNTFINNNTNINNTYINNVENSKNEKSSKFVKPTIDELNDYIKEKGYHFKAENFIAYYDSVGWKIGKNPMRDWKAACRTWENKYKENNKNNPYSSKKDEISKETSYEQIKGKNYW